VLQLHLPVELDLALRDPSLLAVVHRIPHLQARDARQSLCVGHAVKRSFLATNRQREQLASRHHLLQNHSRRSKHSKPSVVQLFRLHLLELGGIRRFQVKGVEAQFARFVFGLDAPRLSARDRLEAED